jgi:DNA transposition AAA+ family ATPase
MNAFNISEGIGTFTLKEMDHASVQGTLETLRSFIQQSRLSEYRVAQMMGVSANALKSWLNGASHPRQGSQTEIKAFLEQHGPACLNQKQSCYLGQR